MQKQTSVAEQHYIRLGCEQGVRTDGRGHDEYRSIVIENSIFPHVNGSSRVRIAGSVDVICSIKAEVTEPKPDQPDIGLLDVAVDVSPAASLVTDDKELQNYGARTADILHRSLRGCSNFPWKELCIIPGRFCWNLQIDFLILQLDGDPLDICSIALYVALQTTLIPKTLPKTASGLNAQKELTSFDVIGTMEDAIAIDFRAVPIVLNVVQVGKVFLLDATQAEQDSASLMVAVGVARKHLDHVEAECTSMQVTMGGSFQSTDLPVIFQKATASATCIFTYLQEYLQSVAMSEDDLNYPDVPPARLGLLAGAERS